jgi:hypothetical protein
VLRLHRLPQRQHRDLDRQGLVDPPCVDYGQRLGHTLVSRLRVATGSGTIQFAGGLFNPFVFIVIDKGRRFAEGRPRHLYRLGSSPDTDGSNQKYVFTIEPVAHMSLALQPGLTGAIAGESGATTPRAGCRSA